MEKPRAQGGTGRVSPATSPDEETWDKDTGFLVQLCLQGMASQRGLNPQPQLPRSLPSDLLAVPLPCLKPETATVIAQGGPWKITQDFGQGWKLDVMYCVMGSSCSILLCLNSPIL